MAQADGVVSNASGAAVRQDINNQIEAAFTNQSGDTSPATTYPCQFYADTANDILKIRDKTTSSTYYSLRTLDGKVILPAGSAAAPAIFFNGETNTGFYEEANDVIAVTHDGTQVCAFGKNMTGNQAQSDCLVYGSASSQTTTPGEGNNNAAIAGFMVAKDGVTQIGSYDKRPLVLNRMATIGGATGLLAFHTNGTQVAQITTNGSAIAYNTASDYRLKQNVVPLTGAKARVNQFNVCRFNFTALPSQTVDGFLAHEAQEIVPEAVTGSKDGVLEDGSPDYQGIDQSKIVPLLTAALQEAFAEIAALTARVEALEAS